MFEISNLSCQRGYQQLFANINLQLNSGDILRIAGHNGKGKTSLLKMIAGIGLIENGQISLSGHLIGSPFYLQNLIYLGHLNAINPLLSVFDNLFFLTNLKQNTTKQAVKKSLEIIGLKYYENELANILSVGQKRRILLAVLQLVDVPLWLLDEPFTALDVEGVALIEALISSHSKQDGICLLTTHQPTQLNHQTLQL